MDDCSLSRSSSSSSSTERYAKSEEEHILLSRFLIRAKEFFDIFCMNDDPSNLYTVFNFINPLIKNSRLSLHRRDSRLFIAHIFEGFFFFSKIAKQTSNIIFQKTEKRKTQRQNKKSVIHHLIVTFSSHKIQNFLALIIHSSFIFLFSQFLSSSFLFNHEYVLQ